MINRELEIEEGQIERFRHDERVSQDLKHIDGRDIQVERVQFILWQIRVGEKDNRSRHARHIGRNREVKEPVEPRSPPLAHNANIHRVKTRLSRHKNRIILLLRTQLRGVLANDSFHSILAGDNNNHREVSLRLTLWQYLSDVIGCEGRGIKLSIDTIQGIIKADDLTS